MISIDELIEIWVRVHQEAQAKYERFERECNADLSWWREAMAHLRPTPEDDAPTLDDENA
jgi:hypothetical protein